MANKRRTFRVAEKIRELIAEELQRMADPRFELVTITKAIVSADLRHAKIYWMVTGDSERMAEVEQAFQHAEGLFKRLMARALGIRFVPDMRFYYDDTIDTFQEVNLLLNRVNGHPVDANGVLVDGSSEDERVDGSHDPIRGERE